MKIHTTNYQDTFIEIAEDCKATKGEMPTLKGDKPTVASLQFDMLYDHPYQYTSDEVLFAVHAQRNEVSAQELEDEKVAYFSKGQACFRASPLTKTYGWGVHSDIQGRIAIYGVESPEYQAFTNNSAVKKVRAMRSKKG